MRPLAYLFGLWFIVGSCASGQKVKKPGDYRFTYRFKLHDPTYSSKIYVDTVASQSSIKTLNTEPLEPNWYNVNSKYRLTEQDLDQIKKCVELNERDVAKCGKKNAYYVTIEI